jgi:hypothetical protein
MKKYLISALIYLTLFSVVNGILDVCFGKSFIEGLLPLSPVRWIVRIGFVSYLTIFRPINSFN